MSSPDTPEAIIWAAIRPALSPVENPDTVAKHVLRCLHEAGYRLTQEPMPLTRKVA